MMGVGGMGSGGGNGIIGLGGGGGGGGGVGGGYAALAAYGQIQQQANEFYGRSQTAGNSGGAAGGNANSDFVKQELRAVVSVRAQQAAAAATGGTPQSPLSQQGPMIGGGNSTNAIGNATLSSSGSSGNPMLNTPPDPTLGFSFETPDFFTSSATR
ncbi:hypothetical protein ACLKA6_012294 [Drosophila palustris]